jgi:hypothetical protein
LSSRNPNLGWMEHPFIVSCVFKMTRNLSAKKSCDADRVWCMSLCAFWGWEAWLTFVGGRSNRTVYANYTVSGEAWYERRVSPNNNILFIPVYDVSCLCEGSFISRSLWRH